MKKIILLSAMASAFLMAGGDIVPVEEPMVVSEPVVLDNSSFYVGVGYSYLTMEETQVAATFETNSNMMDIIVGYNFNQYVAIEGRYGFSVGDSEATDGVVSVDDYDADVSTLSLFVKPQYSFDAFKVYGLLGYGAVNLDYTAEGAHDVTDGGFQYGIGAAYTMDNYEIFVDYTVLYDEDGIDGLFPENAYDVSAITVGLNYKF